LIDSMLVVDPEKRFDIEECLAHPWVTQLSPGQEPSAGKDPVLRRARTLVNKINYTTPAEMSERPNPGGDLISDTKLTGSETKGKRKLKSSVNTTPVKCLVRQKWLNYIETLPSVLATTLVRT
jgi:serine/threonine protein kinase